MIRKLTTAVLAVWLLGAEPARSATEEQAFYDLLRFMQVESQNHDQAFILDTSGSMKATLPVARKMMANFVRDLAREGDRLLVVSVGTDARVLIDEAVDRNNRVRLLRSVEDPRLTDLGRAFEAHTDLDAGLYSVLKRFDGYNEARVRGAGLPWRQLVYTFSDFKREPPPASAFAKPGSPQARLLAGLGRRIEVRKVKTAEEIQVEFQIDFKGVPFRIEQAEFVVPGPTSPRDAAGTFDGYLKNMIAEEFETRRRKPAGTTAYGKRIARMRAAVANRLVVSGPFDFATAPDGEGVTGSIKVKNGFERTNFKDLGLSPSALPGATTMVLPEGRTTLAPGQETTFEVQFPGLAGPAWYATEDARHAGQRIAVQLEGSALVTDVKSRPLSVPALIGPQALGFDIAIPASPGRLYGLLGALALLLLAAFAAAVRWARGPRELALRLRIHDASGEPSMKEAKLAAGGFQMLGGKERGHLPLLGIDEPLLKVMRQGRRLVVEGLAQRLTVMVDAQVLKAGQKVALKEKGRIVVKQDTVGPHVIEIGYQLGAAASPAPQAGPRPDLADPDQPKYQGSGKRRF